MKFRRHCKLLNHPPDAVSFAGVFFLLLFFSLVHAPGGSVDLKGNERTIGIDASGIIFYRNQVVTDQILKEYLGELKKDIGEDLTIVIKANRKLPLNEVMRVVRLIHDARVKNTLISTSLD